MAEETKQQGPKPEEPKKEAPKAPKSEEKEKPKKEAAATAPGEQKPGAKRKLPKGRHLSVIKRHRQSLKKAKRNETVRSTLKTAARKVHQAVVAKNKELAQTTLREATSLFAKAASKGIIHSRNAARHIARLSRLVHQLAA